MQKLRVLVQMQEAVGNVVEPKQERPKQMAIGSNQMAIGTNRYLSNAGTEEAEPYKKLHAHHTIVSKLYIKQNAILLVIRAQSAG